MSRFYGSLCIGLILPFMSSDYVH